MAEVSEQQVLDTLSRIDDPDHGENIVGLGMVSGVVIRDGNVCFTIEVEPERGPDFEPVRKAAEEAVAALPGVLSVTAVLTAERPSSPAHPQDEPILPDTRSIIAIASGKGGVGKSTTAVNLALAFAAKNLAVGIFDADIYGPSMPRMLGVRGRPLVSSASALVPVENYGVKCMSMGFLVPEDEPMIWRGPMVMGAIEQMLGDVAWGELDILVIDLPPGTGDAQLTIAQRVPLTGVVIVSTPQDIALLDARKGLNMFRKVDVPVLGIIENMSYFTCPHCGQRSDIFSHGGARLEAASLGTDFLGEIPLDMVIRETSDGGRPIVVSDPESPHARTYRSIADNLWEKITALTRETARKAPRIVVQ